MAPPIVGVKHGRGRSPVEAALYSPGKQWMRGWRGARVPNRGRDCSECARTTPAPKEAPGEWSAHRSAGTARGTATLHETGPAQNSSRTRSTTSGSTRRPGSSSPRTTASTSSTGAKASASTTSTAASTSTASPVSGSSTPVTAGVEIGEAMAEQAAAARLRLRHALHHRSRRSQLAATLADLTPGDLDRVFFCSGGSEAVETAIKIAKQVQAMRGFPRRYKIIARRGSYHGMTYGAMSLTAIRNETLLRPVHVRRLPRAAPEPLPLRLRRRGRAGRHHGRPATSSRRSRTRDRRRSRR